jgi:tetraacyldisaccharide 4'-kinase
MTLKERIARGAWGPARGPGLALLRAALIPGGWLYGAGWRIRNALPAARARLPARVISVGNVTVGGTGKTPLAAHVAEILARSGARVAVLSRGYGRASREAVVIASDGERVLADAARAGDEPVWLARKLPGVPVIVGADRARTGHLAVEKFGAGALVLDDAFQNRGVAKDLEIVAVDGRRPFGNGRLLPAGPLRMPSGEIARAGVVVLTKLGPEDDPEPARRAIAALAPRARIFEAATSAVGFRDVATGKSVPLDFMRRRRVAAMCGIAEPLAFARLLDEEGFEVVGTYPFPDHHAYTARDVARVRREAHAIEAVVVTEKDEVKIAPAWAQGTPPVLALVTATRVDDEPAFERIVLG